MHEARNQSDDINRFLLSRAITGTNFDFITYGGVEITGREMVGTVCGSQDYRERGWGPYVGIEITWRERVGLYIPFRICKLRV